MQLNEILEENSIKGISQKTKISEENLQNLLNANFHTLKKIKTLGFISIVEREYKADLNALREEALEYYRQHEEDNSFSIAPPVMEDKKTKSKLFIFSVLALLVFVSWYFFIQFDKKHLSQFIPFMDEQLIENVPTANTEKKPESVAADLSIANIVIDDSEANVTIEKTTEDVVTGGNVQAGELSAIKLQHVSIVPVDRLWFGVTDMQTKQREHFSIDQAYELEVETKSWLVVTSSAPFAITDGKSTLDFNDAKEHYFKIDKNGIQSLSKSEYVAQGGWDKW